MCAFNNPKLTVHSPLVDFVTEICIFQIHECNKAMRSKKFFKNCPYSPEHIPG